MEAASKYLLKLDQTSEWIVRKQPRTWAGAGVTVVLAILILCLTIYNIELWFTETDTRIFNRRTIGQTYLVRFRCVSTGGCNVTYRYDPQGVCGELAQLPAFSVEDGQDFNMQVCRARDIKEGTRVTTMFERNRMWIQLNRLWSLELYQDGEYIPIGKVVTNDVRVEKLRNTAIIDRTIESDGIDFWNTKELVRASFWSVEPSDVILFDNECFQATVPFGWICGSMQFTLSDLFVEDIKTKAKEFQPNVMTPTSAMIMVAGFVMMAFSWLRYNDYRLPCCTSSPDYEHDGIALEEA